MNEIQAMIISYVKSCLVALSSVGFLSDFLLQCWDYFQLQFHCHLGQPWSVFCFQSGYSAQPGDRLYYSISLDWLVEGLCKITLINIFSSTWCYFTCELRFRFSISRYESLCLVSFRRWCASSNALFFWSISATASQWLYCNIFISLWNCSNS